MQAVGLHFGHDASCALVAGDGLEHFLDKERRSRVKHALSLSSQDIREVLSRVTEDVILGLSCTQGVPILMDRGLEIEVEGGFPVAFDDFSKQMQNHHYRKFMSWIENGHDYRGLIVGENLFGYQSRLNEGFNKSYEALGSIAGQFSNMAEAQHREATLKLDGKRFKARFYQHHYLHAAYAGWAMSPDKPALILTADGGVGPSFFGGGIYHWKPDSKLLPLTPIDGWVGQFYDSVSEVLGFDAAGGPGKLMGLAPYGRPIYFDQSLVGTRRQVTSDYAFSMPQVVQRWLNSFGIDSGKIPKWDLFTDVPPVLIADIAASAQLVVELNVQELGRAAERLARRAGLAVEAFILSGGVALNCPANSNLAVTLDKPVLVPPAVNDEGLSIGAAISAYFDAAGRYPAGPKTYADGAYIGTDISKADVEAAAAKHGWRAEGELDRAAELILADVPIGLCAGKAEVGPRALGHRSILVNAGSPNTWRAVNQVKRREPWRPFAPAVLLEDAPRYFDRGPPESRFMLFNYRCNTKELPAITHYDHSSRVQHVSEQTGILHQLLLRLKALGAPPVVMNTSFNGPGVPIVDTAEDAFAEASKLGLQYVLTDFGLYRAGQPAAG
jgi:carbamoyltransferase